MHIEPAVPPQNPSVETGPVGADVGAVEEAVDAIVTLMDEERESPPQIPKTDWHPVAQWSMVEPQ